MNKNPDEYPSSVRKKHHLKLNDLAFLLKMDQGNLSRFEAGKISNPKALIGYHILLNLSIENSIRQVFEGNYKELSDRCFQLVEKISEGPNTPKNRLRLEGLDTVIDRLMQFDKVHA
jgi:transcriptional regulator with XRE-family HTH domain